MSSAFQPLVDRVKSAAAAKTPLQIRGAGTKAFYGGTPQGELLDMQPCNGITSYEPTELVVTVKAGTPLAELDDALLQQGQYLPFDPPRFGGDGGTVGGMVAAGLAGPARASVGSVRDYVLGATMINGSGELLSFGGQVMKNVAGYDVSRLLAGSLGVLGVICEVSLKVLPLPVASATLRAEMTQMQALRLFNQWAGQPLPIHAGVWWDDTLAVWLRGATAAVRTAAQRIVQDLRADLVDADFAEVFWTGLRDHRDEFFQQAYAAVQAGATLWRMSVPSIAAPLVVSGEQLIEWGGAQRWICTTAPAAQLRQLAHDAGGHATLFHGLDKSPGVFEPLAAPLDRVHRELKRAFDPLGILNRGRLYPDM
jgi:glycolate oxidase FAD binding subunit